MSYFAAGAWWSTDGKAFPTQAEADAHEQSGDAGADSDEFARAMGRGTQSRGTTPAPQAGRTGAKTAPAPASSFSRPLSPTAQQSRATAGQGQGFYEQSLLDMASDSAAVFNPVQYGAGKVGNNVNRAVGNVFDRGIDAFARQAVSPRTNVSTDLRPEVSGYIQDPFGQFLSDVGAPDLVAAGANPTGFLNRTAVNAGTGYGLDVPQVAASGARAVRNIANDARNAPGVFADGVRAVGNAASGAAGAIGGFARDIATRSNIAGQGSGANAATYQPAPIPQPSMTPQQILGMQTNAARPSSAQSDAIVNQMLAQSQVQSGYQDFNSPQYNQSRNAAMGYTSGLAGLANNNVAITGLESGRYDQSRGTVNQITGQLQAQANNNVADIQANSAQRDSSRAGVLNTAGRLQDAAYQNVDRIDASQGQRLGSQSSMVDVEKRLTSGMNSVGDIQANAAQYNDGRAQQQATMRNIVDMANRTQAQDPTMAANRATSNDIIARLIAASEAQEGPSAAESLMLNAQERATRNALGNAASMGGGWRSQLTNQRQALGQAATMQADIAAQLGALRANEAATFRGQSIDALGRAGGFAGELNAGDIAYRGQSLGALGQVSGQQGDMSARDLALAQSDAALLAQIRQGNQANTRESQIAAGMLAGQRMNSDTAVAMSDADRAMVAAQGNQQNRLNALLGAGGLQTGAMVSDTNLAQSNAALLAQIRQGNQQNALNSLLGAGNTASNVLSADLGFATNDAQIRTQRELANQQNALNAMLGAANAANTTAGMDANIGMNNANNRVTVDQNNRANSIAALQNAGVLSSTIRGQDVQLSVADQQALTQRISAAAGLSGTQYAAQMNHAMQTQDLELRRQQFEFMKTQAPREYERWLAAAGSTAGLLGLIL